MNIALFGSTGMLGRAILQEAVARGLHVRMLSRRDLPADAIPEGVVMIKGDYFNAESVRETLEGTDAVLSTIGPPIGRKSGLKPDNFGQGMRQLIEEMQRADIKRIVNVAGVGTRFGNEPLTFGRRVLRGLLWSMAPLMTPSKEQELSILSASGLDWTTVRPPIIKTGHGGTLAVSDSAPQGYQVDTVLVARFMLDQLTSDAWVGKAPFVGSS